MMRHLLDEFGDREDVLRALTRNMCTFGWTGSRATYFALYSGPLRELQSHPIGAVRRWAEKMELTLSERSRQPAMKTLSCMPIGICSMAAFDSALSHDSEARRLAVEVIATLVNVKRIAADQILRPAKGRFLTGNDATTGQPLTKRQAGALILDELARRGGAFIWLIRAAVPIG
jgi:hypothetical protein